MESVKTFGGTVVRDGFGEIRFSKGKVKSGLVGHGMGVAKLDTFAAVPEVIREGIQIGLEKTGRDPEKTVLCLQHPLYTKAKAHSLG